MRAAATLVACLLAAGSAGVASAAEPPSASEDLTLHLLPLDAAAHVVGEGDAMVELGDLSAAEPRRLHGRGVVARTRVAVRLDSPSGRLVSARLEAFLASETAGCTVRVDGITLSAVPRLIDAVHRVGEPVVHEIEVSVSPSAPEGTLLSEIEWVAESD